MNAISAPIPEPIPPDPPAIAIVEPPSRLGPRRVIAIGAAALVVLGVAAAWMVARGHLDPTADQLSENLGWMFEAALTYPGADRSGDVHPPPAIALTVREVTVVDQRRGPLMATVDLARLDGTVARVIYRIDLTRQGDAWTVAARPVSGTPLSAQEAEANAP